MSEYFEIKNLQTKVIRFYDRGDIFTTYITNTSLFPLKINLPKIKESHIQKNYQDVIKGIKKLELSNLPIEYKDFSFKSIGKQRLPIKIRFTSLEHYLHVTQKQDEYKQFTTLCDTITQKYPKLKELFIKKPFIILEYKDVWSELLAVVEFLLTKPKPNIYIRELSINSVDTKFVEKYKKTVDLLVSTIRETTSLNSLANYAFEKKYHFLYQEPLIRFRILDDSLFIQGLSDLSLPKSQFQSLLIECEKIFIIENKVTTLSFPKVKSAIVIFGQGYGVSTLKDIPWMKSKNIFYWGDIDTDGYAILSQLRGYYPQTESFLMDRDTLEHFKQLGVFCARGALPKTVAHLTDSEKEVYDELCRNCSPNGFRIEQERIPFDYLLSNLLKDGFN